MTGRAIDSHAAIVGLLCDYDQDGRELSAAGKRRFIEEIADEIVWMTQCGPGPTYGNPLVRFTHA